MKRLTAIASALVLLLSLAACWESSAATETAPVPPVAAAAKPSVEAAPEQAPLSAAYAEILKSGTYRYVLTVKTTTATQTVVSAAKGGVYYISTGVPGDSFEVLVRDGTGYAVRK